jgi:tRNA A37 threonylcarbamoyladenosine synthetase subunit TsaC/SUA5/YrdC
MLADNVFLTQTDTTIGFISQSESRLTLIKQRPPYKHYIRAVNSLETLKTFTRVPQRHKKRVRRAVRATFIMPSGDSFRVIRDTHHLLLLDRLKWAYTTSANLSGEVYREDFAKEKCDVIVTPLQGSTHPSAILQLGHQRVKRIR